MFQNKTAVVTGAGSGIGRALALQLAQAGARLALSDIDQSGLAETIRQVEQRTGSGVQSGSLKDYALDVTDEEAVSRHAEEVLRDFGRVDLLFNNAGATMVGTVEHTSLEEFKWQIDVNMWSVVYLSKAFLPVMLSQKSGTLINISSVLGLLSLSCQSAYSMSKFAVRGFTECLWSELEGTGVNAVCVHPGGIKTNIEKSGRRAKLANAVEEKISGAANKILITTPDRCAQDILKGVAKGKRRILTGNHSNIMFWMSRILPNSYPGLLKLLQK